MATFERPEEILSVWEAEWHELTPEQRSSFLRKPEVSRLLRCDADIVRRALADHQLLAQAVLRAEELQSERYPVLDAQQAEAVQAPVRNTLVTARAGSGKTLVLTERAVWLLTNAGAAPDEVLLMAFNRKAAGEMKERLRKRLPEGAQLPHVMTFDALAWALVQPTSDLLVDDIGAGQRAMTRQVASLQERRSNFRRVNSQDLRGFLSSLMRRPSVREFLLGLALVPFKSLWRQLDSEEKDLEAEDAELLLSHRTRSSVLRGDRLVAADGTYVRSEGEILISNALFLHGVKASYEEPVGWDGTVYRPDFMIHTGDDTGVVIEYFGMVGNPDYDRQTEEKRRYWEERHGWELIELYPRDIAAGGEAGLNIRLQRLLSDRGIPWQRLSDEEILDQMPGELVEDRFTPPLTNFIMRCRRERLLPDELHRMILSHHPDSEEEQEFLDLAVELYALYLLECGTENLTDFHGIMWDAVSRAGQNETSFVRDRGREAGDLANIKHILIDEYQDFSRPFQALVEAIQTASPEARVFAVGDDWQGINGFAGADLQYFTRFDQFFANSASYQLTTNYRSSRAVVSTSNAVMAEVEPSGPSGTSSSNSSGLVRMWTFDSFVQTTAEEDLHGDERLASAVARLVWFHLEVGRRVVVLSRTNEIASGDLRVFLDLVLMAIPEDRHQYVDISTTHSYKGLECDAVIVPDADEGWYPLIHPDWKYQRIFGDTVHQLTSEERRLFYVATSRAIDSLDIIKAKEEVASPFLASIDRHAAGPRRGYWRTLPPPHSPDDPVISIRVSGSTFPVKEHLKRQRFRWNSPEKCWRRTLPSSELPEYAALEDEPWFAPGVRVEVLAWDDTILFSSLNG